MTDRCHECGCWECRCLPNFPVTYDDRHGLFITPDGRVLLGLGGLAGMSKPEKAALVKTILEKLNT